MGDTLIKKIGRRLQVAKHGYLRFTSHFVPAIRGGAKVLNVLTFIASVVCLLSLVVYFGFDHTTAEFKVLSRVVRGCQIVFLVNIVYNLLLDFRATCRNTKVIKWVVDIGVLISLLPLVYPHPENPWIPVLERVLYSNKFLFAVLGAYSVVDFCFGVVKVLGKRTNPSMILSVSFLFFIFIGTFLLMMPRCTVNGISFIDALFVSTSAVCITGLTPIDVSQTFTPSGLLILALLIQTGGLGVMTFTCFFALFFSGNTSIYSQLLVKDMIYSKSLSSLLPTLLYIFVFTLGIEAAGAVMIFFSVHGTLGMDLRDELVFSGFHSLSAFCNAGFSNIEGGLSNPALLYHNRSVYLIVSLLVFAGGIGFPILVNFKSAFVLWCRVIWNRVVRGRTVCRPAHIYDLNTKIVLVASLWIMAVSTLLFFLMEYDNTLDGMSMADKLVQSLFNSFVPRSSGFSSVSPGQMLNITIVMFVFLMWIGGASQSTAGGIKVNTFATMLLNLRAVILGKEKIVAYDRTISTPSIRRAHAVISLSIIGYVVYAMLLIALEPHLSVKELLYEAASALFTVGSSLGVTSELSGVSKGVVCTAMFLGRVGMISLLVGFVKSRPDSPAKFPADNIIIN